MSTENLSNQEAIEKLTEIVNKTDIGMFATFSANDQYPNVVPMSRQEVDEQGNIWYILSSESSSHTNLVNNKKVSIYFSHVQDYTFMSINGVAEVYRDQGRIDKYWNKMIEAWFEKGKEDERIRVVKVSPSETHYWDNKTSKLVTLFKLAVNAVSDAKLDIGREGSLEL